MESASGEPGVKDEAAYREERERMVAEQLAGRNIRDPHILEAMRQLPRHLFVPPENRHLAYQDAPVDIGQEQTISQPYIAAIMTQLLELQGDEMALEVGTGSGYQAALLGMLAREVHTVERHFELAQRADEILRHLHYNNVYVHPGDGSHGLATHAPYDAILVSAASPGVPPALLHQLAEGGRLILPVGSRISQHLERWRRMGEAYQREVSIPVAFVPLLGDFGWPGD